jgi:hypothetical protein
MKRGRSAGVDGSNASKTAAMPKPISLAQQIEEVEREIKLRENALQSYGRTGRSRASEAEFHVMRMSGRGGVEALPRLRRG